eukprot:CAMPEP_0119561188 /NCGR_PEP_ID=MMETSP1352-20130426/16940_1 /TAXON_ID=265584 /ORGANISM="Stauroneis constricta, Strain CCMP1120" /LENGTH=49 /DNA_ID=CAMNT_0007609345 /DNA_START=13 /DNA_END=162 /DNA_ORIENTATION=+
MRLRTITLSAPSIFVNGPENQNIGAPAADETSRLKPMSRPVPPTSRIRT